jgi:hypothetical protein
MTARLTRFLGERGRLLETDERQNAEDRGSDNPGDPPVLRVVGELGAENRERVMAPGFDDERDGEREDHQDLEG